MIARVSAASLVLLLTGLPAWAHPKELHLTPAEQGVAAPTGIRPCDPRGPTGWPGLALPPEQIGAWSPPFPWPVQATHASVLHTGKVLFWREGEEGLGSDTITFVWNPENGHMNSALTPSSELFCSGHATLGDGRLLVGGGNDGAELGWGPVDTNLFDPLTESWTRVADMEHGRYYATLTLLADGRVVAVSGIGNPWSPGIPIPEVYDPVADDWETLNSAINWFPVYPHDMVLPSGHLLFAGPTIYSQLLDTRTWTWSAAPTATYFNIIGSAVQYEPGKIMKCAGGSGPTQFPFDSKTEILDMTAASPAWTVTSPMHHARGWLNLVVLPDGKVLALGGATGGSGWSGDCAVHAPELWDPTTHAWSVMASHERPREYHSTAILLPDGRVVAAGGENTQFGLGGEGNYEIYSPPYLFRGDRPAVDWAPGSIGYAGTFSVRTPDAVSIAKVALVRPSSVTHSFDENQRYVPLTYSVQPTRLVVTAPPNEAWAPPGYYLLFLVDTNGVPSIGEFVRLGGCTASADAEAQCTNGLDDDCDGMTDIEDPGCGQPPLPFAPAGAVPDGGPLAGIPLKIERVPGDRLELSWGASCSAGATDYAIYEGVLGDWASHVPVFCSTNGTTERTFGREGDNYYYLVVPRNAIREGSYGRDSAGQERAASALACRPQEIGSCAGGEGR